MHDYHIHCSYSIDAKGEMEDYVRSAIAKGLGEICITTHIDLNPSRMIIDLWASPGGHNEPLSAAVIRRYLDRGAELAEKYAEQIIVKTGFEFSYAPHFEEIVADFLAKYPVPFSIGSLHCIDNIGFTAGAEVGSVLRFYNPQDFLEKYAELTIQLAESRLFSTIGHIDGYKKYAGRHWDIEKMHQAEEAVFPMIFRKLAELGAGYEINTAAFRKGLGEFYPSKDLIQLAQQHGVLPNSTGSDAHEPSQVGFMIKEANELLAELGIEI